MTIKPTRPFTLTFIGIALLEMLGDSLDIRVLHYGCKPLIMALLMLYVWQFCQAVGFVSYIRWLLIGMLFALLGDILLMIQEIDLFAAGLGAFLLMQICYSIAFLKSIQAGGQTITSRRLGKSVTPFGLYLIIFLALLRPVFVGKPDLEVLWWPVVIYAICLNTMGLLATQRQDIPGYNQVVIGALLFILSDSAIAVNKFLSSFGGSTWLVMTTYATAQYLIMIGMIQQVASNVPEKP
ncbi:lysoplasmalogenase [Spirosoma aerolatum]|uniref:lysoplasmalogenase n=1 Tax=Spirosoma aerolatum TaxID=1211326 RepID=UPI001FE2C8C7|nr:lysoplasmalogenase [Spirosoma aerolatum]